MNILDLGDIAVHWRADGPEGGVPVVFLNSLGTDLRVWDKVVARLPGGVRAIRMDKRGHGLTDATPAPYSMGMLVRDAERVLDAVGVHDAVVVGLSIGGMIAQGLAVKRPDLVGALVLSNTAVRIGTPDIWEPRIAAIRDSGIEPLADGIMERWFAKPFRATPELPGWRNMLVRTTLDGYVGCCAAISGTDFYSTTATLTLPTMVIAGSEDGATPPDMVRETCDLIAGAQFHLIRGVGHLPCVEAPEVFSDLLNGFLANAGRL